METNIILGFSRIYKNPYILGYYRTSIDLQLIRKKIGTATACAIINPNSQKSRVAFCYISLAKSTPQICYISNVLKHLKSQKTCDTPFVSVKLPKCMYSQYIFNFEPKNEPQYIVPALFFPVKINQLNITPLYW